MLFDMRSDRLDPAAVVQGSGLPVDDVRHMVLGPGRLFYGGRFAVLGPLLWSTSGIWPWVLSVGRFFREPRSLGHCFLFLQTDVSCQYHMLKNPLRCSFRDMCIARDGYVLFKLDWF
jgi:hypothetical protein